MKAGDTFPIRDVGCLPPDMRSERRKVRAVYTGEHRSPRAGEWFLSGAIVEAYFSHGCLSGAYPIARLAVVGSALDQLLAAAEALCELWECDDPFTAEGSAQTIGAAVERMRAAIRRARREELSAAIRRAWGEE